ncbi:MAG TPA: HAMP domain-containing sensor histidine kinase [Armatimonadota bacterium]|nr:HAMP domain-containing sensor histidine kinase [Armatimonadota bacterium]
MEGSSGLRDSSAREGPSLSQVELAERIRWLILLRWFAFVGVATTILIARSVFVSALPWNRLLLTAFAIPTYNVLFYIAWQRANRAGTRYLERISYGLANAQILCDLVMLGALIHLSGGVENLFCFYFVFHMVIASILLSARAAFAQATVAVLIFATIGAGEYYGILPHYESPIGMQVHGLHRSGILVFAAGWVLASALYVTVYLATSITARLRWREDQVMALSQQTTDDAQRLRIAYDKLAETERAKSAYARKVAHELRSPLAAIDGLLRAVSEGLAGEIPEQPREMVDRARIRTHELLDVARDLLVLASARDAKLSAQWSAVDLRSTLDDIVRLLAPQAEARQIRVTTEVSSELPEVQGDPEGLKELLTNLLTNAIKYSREESVVEVRIGHRGTAVEIEVSDSGIGIAEEDQTRIFDEFYRGGNARAFTAEGTGLGLSIVHSIVEAHGGTITVESREGAGTTFSIVLNSNPSA